MARHTRLKIGFILLPLLAFQITVGMERNVVDLLGPFRDQMAPTPQQQLRQQNRRPEPTQACPLKYHVAGKEKTATTGVLGLSFEDMDEATQQEFLIIQNLCNETNDPNDPNRKPYKGFRDYPEAIIRDDKRGTDEVMRDYALMDLTKPRSLDELKRALAARTINPRDPSVPPEYLTEFNVLDIASFSGMVRAVEWMVEMKVHGNKVINIHQGSRGTGYTPLHHAVQKAQKDVVKLLVHKYNANPNSIDKRRNRGCITPLLVLEKMVEAGRTGSDKRIDQAMLAKYEEIREVLTELTDCVICMSEPATEMILPCHHQVCCPDCANQLQQDRRRPGKCPMCRVQIIQTMNNTRQPEGEQHTGPRYTS